VPPSFIDGNETKVVNDKEIISCSASGIPAPSLTWLFNEGPLPRNIKATNDTDGMTALSQIHLSSIGEVYGNFSCTADNFHGRDEKVFMVVHKGWLLH